MKKNLLLLEGEEITPEVIRERTNSKGEKETYIKVLWQRADVVNINKRLYPRGLLEREISKMNQRIDAGFSVFGHAFHPSDGFGKLTDVTHKWKGVWMEPDGRCLGLLSLVDTRAGQDIKAVMKAGKVGISSRGFGTTTEKTKDGKKYLEVNNDFSLETPGDFVTAPSVVGAGTLSEALVLLESQLIEAGEDEEKKEEEKMKKQQQVKKARFISEDPVMYEAKLASSGQTARAPIFPRDPKYTGRAPFRPIVSPRAPLNPLDPTTRLTMNPPTSSLHRPLKPLTVEKESKLPKHKFLTEQQLKENAKKIADTPPDPYMQVQIEERRRGQEAEAISRQKIITPPAKKGKSEKSLKEQVENLAERIDGLVSRFDKVLGEEKE